MIIKVKIRDVDGDYFIIPNNLIQKFDKLVELYYDAEEYSEESQIFAEKIELEYGIYKTGGDVNNIQLYTDKKVLENYNKI